MCDDPLLLKKPNPGPRLSVRGHISNTALERLLQVKAAEVFFGMVSGAGQWVRAPLPADQRVHPLHTTGEASPCAANKLSSLVAAAVGMMENQLGVDSSSPKFMKNGMYFYPTRLISPYLDSPTVNKTWSSQYNLSPDIGLFISRSRAYLVYCTTHQGMAWRPTSFSRIRVPYSAFAQAVGSETTATDSKRLLNEGVILCNNAKEFMRAYLDPYHVRENGGQGQYRFGAGLAHTYLLPLVREAAALFRDVIMGGEDSMTKLLDGVEWSYGFERSLDSVFPFRYMGYRVANCIAMDLSILNRIQRAIDMGDDNIILMTLPWQKPFYKKIFIDISFIEIEIE